MEESKSASNSDKPAHRLLPPDVGSMEDVEEPHTHDRDPAPSLVAVTHFFPISTAHRVTSACLLTLCERTCVRLSRPPASWFIFADRAGAKPRAERSLNLADPRESRSRSLGRSITSVVSTYIQKMCDVRQTGTSMLIINI
jgi:hypothetical protein